jgi:hypothetical protein
LGAEGKVKYAILDANNGIREIREDYGPLPQNAVLLSDTQYSEMSSSADAYWKFAGGEFQKTPIPVPGPAIPNRITMRQARLALLQSGLLPQVDAAVAAITGAEGDAARIDWQFAQTVERTHPLVATMTAQLNLTAKQLDDLFTLGATL